jgi:hypothetical protein
MTIDELKVAAQTQQSNLEAKAGSIVSFSKTGPVGMSMIFAMIEALETLERRVSALEAAAAKP